MHFKFEKIIVWQNAMKLGEKINTISESFPKKERFNLSNRILRAGGSIALNLTEGSISQTNREFRRFVGYIIRSRAEVVICLYKATNRNYISHKSFKDVYSESYSLMNMMTSFRRNIN